jgi:hypothetical protein
VRNTYRRLVALGFITALVGAFALPATAAETAVTFSIGGGSLSLSAAGTAAWGEKGSSGTTLVSGQLGDVTVTDQRGGDVGWSVGAATTNVTDGVTSATTVRYLAGVVTPTGVVTPLSDGMVTLTGTSGRVVRGTVVVGNNTATWNPTLLLTLPASSTCRDVCRHGDDIIALR